MYAGLLDIISKHDDFYDVLHVIGTTNTSPCALRYKADLTTWIKLKSKVVNRADKATLQFEIYKWFCPSACTKVTVREGVQSRTLSIISEYPGP